MLRSCLLSSCPILYMSNLTAAKLLIHHQVYTSETTTLTKSAHMRLTNKSIGDHCCRVRVSSLYSNYKGISRRGSIHGSSVSISEDWGIVVSLYIYCDSSGLFRFQSRATSISCSNQHNISETVSETLKHRPVTSAPV